MRDATFERLLGDDPWMPRGLIAELDGRPVGLTHYLFHAHCWRTERVCYLQDLFTDGAARGHGVGEALVAGVYAAADAEGAPSVYWLTQDFNATARRLYDRIAARTPFVRYDRDPAKRLSGGSGPGADILEGGVVTAGDAIVVEPEGPR